MNARLVNERDTLEALLARTRRAELRLVSPDLRYYEVAFNVRTLVRGHDGVVREEERSVPVAYDLAENHPLIPPLAVALTWDLFNPHVNDPRQKLPLPPVPVLCLGGFPAARRIADLVTATYYLLGYARIATHHGLNPQAVQYARSAMASGRFPIERRPFIEPTRRAEGSPA